MKHNPPTERDRRAETKGRAVAALRKARERKEVPEMAADLRCSSVSVTRWLSGEYEPNYFTALRILETYA